LRTSYAQYKKATLIIQVAFAYSKHQKHFPAIFCDYAENKRAKAQKNDAQNYCENQNEQ